MLQAERAKVSRCGASTQQNLKAHHNTSPVGVEEPEKQFFQSNLSASNAFSCHKPKHEKGHLSEDQAFGKIPAKDISGALRLSPTGAFVKTPRAQQDETKATVIAEQSFSAKIATPKKPTKKSNFGIELSEDERNLIIMKLSLNSSEQVPLALRDGNPWEPFPLKRKAGRPSCGHHDKIAVVAYHNSGKMNIFQCLGLHPNGQPCKGDLTQCKHCGLWTNKK